MLLENVRCYKEQSKRFGVLPMALLPQFRVNFTFPFSHTGVNFMEPLYVRNAFCYKDETLVFIVAYTCAWAIRLDVVVDASCSSFIHSLKRFISVNRVSDLYISDNGKCFTGRELKDYLSTLSTSRRYILEVSPCWGGFWERMVQVVKRSLWNILSKSKLAYEELLIFICEIESVINSWPLCCVYDDSIEEIITPSHLFFVRHVLTKWVVILTKTTWIVTLYLDEYIIWKHWLFVIGKDGYENICSNCVNVINLQMLFQIVKSS